jgi:hypothetical protein
VQIASAAFAGKAEAYIAAYDNAAKSQTGWKEKMAEPGYSPIPLMKLSTRSGW